MNEETWIYREIEKCESLLESDIRDVNKIGIIYYLKSLKENKSEN